MNWRLVIVWVAFLVSAAIALLAVWGVVWLVKTVVDAAHLT